MSAPAHSHRLRRPRRFPIAIGCAGGSRCRGSWRSPSISRFRTILALAPNCLITILFALSLDLVLGYAGIVTLGHAAFFGVGAYTVGMLAHHGIWNEPITACCSRPASQPFSASYPDSCCCARPA